MFRIEAFVIVLLKVLEYVLSSQCSGFIKLVSPQNSTIPESFQKKNFFFSQKKIGTTIGWKQILFALVSGH